MRRFLQRLWVRVRSREHHRTYAMLLVGVFAILWGVVTFDLGVLAFALGIGVMALGPVGVAVWYED